MYKALSTQGPKNGSEDDDVKDATIVYGVRGVCKTDLAIVNSEFKGRVKTEGLSLEVTTESRKKGCRG